jgi:hypothetical protein
MWKRFSLILLGITFVLLWLLYGFVWHWLSTDWTEAGQRGDMYGGFSALVTAFALLAAFLAYRSQREELELQRTELALQREELTSQRELQSSEAVLAALGVNVEVLTHVRDSNNTRADEAQKNGLTKESDSLKSHAAHNLSDIRDSRDVVEWLLGDLLKKSEMPNSLKDKALSNRSSRSD